MHTSTHFDVKHYLSAFLTERENPTRPFSFSEVGATIRFIVRDQLFHAMTVKNAMDGDTIQSSVDRISDRLLEKVFPIEVGILLSTESSMGYIAFMLTEVLSVPPPESLKIEISRFARFWASVCPQRNARLLDLVIELHVGTFYDTVVIFDENSVPPSRSSTQPFEIKIFDDTKEKLPSSSSSSTTTTTACMICMDKYVRGIEIVQLPCSHYFHRECILKWLEQKNTCPVCRFAIPPEQKNAYPVCRFAV